jgi:hypothetical protein
MLTCSQIPYGQGPVAPIRNEVYLFDERMSLLTLRE